MKQNELTTIKMPGETEQQYMAWLLYCEAGSIPRMIRAWEQLREGIGETSGIWGEKMQKLGKLPAERNIEKWSSKYQWVERKELKLVEDLKSIRDKSEKIKQEKLHRIAEAFERVTNKILKRLREGEEPTINEWKQIWEMLRTELGESIGKHEVGVDEYEQSLPEYKEQAEPLTTINNQTFEVLLYPYLTGRNKKTADELIWLTHEITEFIVRGRFKKEKSQEEIFKKVRSAWEEIRKEFYTKEEIENRQQEYGRKIQTAFNRLIDYPDGKKEHNPLLDKI